MHGLDKSDLSKHRKHKLPAVIKYIEGFNCFWSLLFVSKDQVNPLVQMLRYVFTLLQDETTIK
jgi:hypothetical protein